MSHIEFREVGFRFSEKWILRGLSFKFQGPALVAIVGASGSGKTTLLKLIAGLLEPTEGEIARASSSTGWVPQDVGLFPWMTVAENVAFPMRLRGNRQVPNEEGAIMSVCKSLGIGNLMSRMPAEISGGEAQRVGIARAIASGSDILLMDEPFSALDDANIGAALQLIQKEFIDAFSGLGFISSHKIFEGILPTKVQKIYLDISNDET